MEVQEHLQENSPIDPNCKPANPAACQKAAATASRSGGASGVLGALHGHDVRPPLFLKTTIHTGSMGGMADRMEATTWCLEFGV